MTLHIESSPDSPFLNPSPWTRTSAPLSPRKKKPHVHTESPLCPQRPILVHTQSPPPTPPPLSVTLPSALLFCSFWLPLGSSSHSLHLFRSPWLHNWASAGKMKQELQSMFFPLCQSRKKKSTQSIHLCHFQSNCSIFFKRWGQTYKKHQKGFFSSLITLCL